MFVLWYLLVIDIAAQKRYNGIYAKIKNKNIKAFWEDKKLNFSKKLLVLLTAACVLFSFAACSTKPADNTVAQNGQLTVPAGVYIANVMGAYTEAQSIWKEENPEATEMRNIVKEKILGMSAEEWINNKAQEKFKTYLMIETLFAKYGMELSEASIAEADQWMSYIWMNAEETYTLNGVSEESMRLIILNSIKENYVFDYEYSAEGMNDVEALAKEYYNTNYERVVYLMLPKVKADAEGYSAEDEAQKLSLMQDAKTAVEAGDDVDGVAYAFHLAQGNITAEDTLADGSFDSVLNMITISQSEFSLFAEAVKQAEVDSANVFEDENYYYFFYKKPLEVEYDADTYLANRADIVYELKWEEFSENLLTRAETELADWTIDSNLYSKYNAKKIKMILM